MVAVGRHPLTTERQHKLLPMVTSRTGLVVVVTVVAAKMLREPRLLPEHPATLAGQ